jgi:hypothetical protein
LPLVGLAVAVADPSAPLVLGVNESYVEVAHGRTPLGAEAAQIAVKIKPLG